MGLRVALRDGEKIVVNGAVLRSFGRTELRVESRAAILRGKDIMRPQDAITPARQLYFHTMMAYIDPDGLDAHQKGIIDAVGALTGVLQSDEARSELMRYAREAAGMAYYRALGACRGLMRFEELLLAEAA